MKSKFAQFIVFASKIDRHHLQFAYFALTVFAAFVIQAPSEGGIGPTR